MQTNILKIVIGGDGGVGKTTLLHRFVTGSFDAKTGMTIGVQFHKKEVEIEGKVYALSLWDLGGQDRFRFMLPSYTIGARGAILMFDLTRMSSLEALEEWAGICRSQSPNLPILLLGSKLDLPDERTVDVEYAHTFVESLNCIDYLEVSSKTGDRVEDAFTMITRKILGI